MHPQQGVILMSLKLGGLHVKHAVQLGIWEPSQHLLEVRFEAEAGLNNI
jgi:hypothetical protein